MTVDAPQILLVVGSRTIWRSFQPIALALLRRGVAIRILAHTWAPKNLGLHQATGSTSSAPTARDLLISLEEAQQQRWRYVVYSESLDDFRLKGHKVYVSHGMMFGNPLWTRALAAHADTYICRSSAEFDYLDQVLGSHADRMQRFNFGSPRMDRFARFLTLPRAKKHRTRRKISRHFGLQADRPTVLVTSHYSSRSNLKTFGARMLQAILDRFSDAQLLVTCHAGFFGRNPKERFLASAGVRTQFDFAAFEADIARLEQRPDFAFARQRDPFDLLPIADVVVCDYSSVMLEAAILGIPILHRSHAYDFHDCTKAVIAQSGPSFTDLEDMLEGLEPFVASRSDIGRTHPGREAFVRHFYTPTGQCVADICEFLVAGQP